MKEFKSRIPRPMQMPIFFVCSWLFKRAPSMFWPASMLAMLSSMLKSEDVAILTQPALEAIQLDLSSLALSYQCTKACYGLREAPKPWEEARDKTLTSFVFPIDGEEYSLRKGRIPPQSLVCCQSTMHSTSTGCPATR